MTKDQWIFSPTWIKAARSAWSKSRALTRERNRAFAGVAKADIARRQFRWNDAEAEYRAYLAIHPGDAGIAVRLAQTLIAAGRLDDAGATLESGLKAAPRSGALRRAVIELEKERSRWRSLTFHPEAALPEAPKFPAESWQGVSRCAPNATLRPEAEHWLRYALHATGAAAVYGDHVWSSGRDGASSGLVLFGAAHIEDLVTAPVAPVVALFSEAAAPDPDADLRQALIRAFKIGPVLHLPLVLAEAPYLPEHPPQPISRASKEDARMLSRLLVVVPTRDEAEALKGMVDSLRARAARPELLDLVVVDNGSRDPATLQLLRAWQADGSAEVLRINEPFNWADLNNRAVAGRTQEEIVFINNDMEMLSPDWDARLRAHLARPDVGVVGARLLYPAGNLQHAGLALGVPDPDQEARGPLHEGLGASGLDRGPMDRWVRTRPAAAVTGAFLAVRRETFERAGGFDAVNFPVSCNDVDFCLRVRALGLTVLYAADIELRHDESLTRGHDDDPVRRARAAQEKAALVVVWGEDAERDPSRNPHWVAHHTLLFHHLMSPTREAVMAEIARGGDPWRTSRRSEAGHAEASVNVS